MNGIKVVGGGKSLFGLILALFAVPSWACFQVYSHDELKSAGDYQTQVASDHNMARFEYNASVDGWVIVESWYEPMADYFVAESGDFVWSSQTGDNSILFIPASASGGGSTPPPPIPPGDPSPPIIPNAADPLSGVSFDAGVLSCGFSTEPPKKLDEIGVVGIGFTIFRSWLSGVGTGIGIVRNGPPSGSGGSGTASNPIGLHGTAKCSTESVDREKEASAIYLAHHAPISVECRNQRHRGRHYRVNFSDGTQGVYKGTFICPATLMFHEVESPSC